MILRALLQLVGVVFGTMAVGVMSVFVLSWRATSWLSGTGPRRTDRGRGAYAPAA